MNNTTKYALSLVLSILFCISGNAITVEYTSAVPKNTIGTTKEAESEFLRLAKKHRIPTRKVTSIKGVFEGYYLIAGAFGEKKNAERMKKSLASKGLNTGILYNNENGLNYVYLAYFNSGTDAIRSCLKGVNGKYTKALWILNVANGNSLKEKPVKSFPVEEKANSLVAFKSAARKLNIANRVIEDADGIAAGFYIIAGVYGEKENAEKHLTTLGRSALDASILLNPKNNMHYVSLGQFIGWEDALEAASSQFNGQYTQKVWVLSVINREKKEVDSSTQKSERANASQTDAKLYKALVEEKDIPSRSDPGFSTIDSGYYLVAGVFGNAENATRYFEKISRKQTAAFVEIHPESKLHYVFLKQHYSGTSAIKDYLSGMEGSYKDPMWILHIDRPSEENTPKVKALQTVEKANPGPYSYPLSSKSALAGRFLKDPGSKDKLLEKADSYFDKMWYAEAAELYELILNEGPENQTFEIIRKAGDSHYFNTNMERAYYWYDILYDKYKSDMKAENLFKYAHSLKGTGKYGRAKRLMKLYNKAQKEESASRRYRPRPDEAILDNILDTEEEMEIKNLDVNSEYSDFSPAFYQDSKMVFASAMDSAFFNTRRYKWNNQPYLDLYVAKINKESDEVRNAVKFSKKINTKYHEAAVTFSPDQKTIYFTRNNYGKKLKRDNKGVNHLKIYMSHKVGDEWSQSVERPFNRDSYSTGHPAISPDGTKLYFVSDMPGSMGKTDLFVVDILGDGNFSDPRNLGPEINTERREMFPFISNNKLYFASDGHVGLGGLDVYSAELSEDGFSEVQNLGQPINSKRDDFSYIIDESTQKGFFASNRRGGKGDDDIYSFKRILPEEPNENAIAGVVTEIVTGEVMPKALVVLLDENNMKLKEMETGEDGSFVFEELEGNTRYVIRTVKDDYFEDEQLVTTEDNQRIEVDVKLKRLEELIVLEDGLRKLKTEMIYFDFDKFNIRKDASEELDKLVQVMKTYPAMVIKIESHTDSRGKRAYNKYLSDRRAKSTRDYLISKGIDPKRIESAVGYGEDRLLNECNGTVRCSSAKHQLNRRSEFIIVNM